MFPWGLPTTARAQQGNRLMEEETKDEQRGRARQQADQGVADEVRELEEPRHLTSLLQKEKQCFTASSFPSGLE